MGHYANQYLFDYSVIVASLIRLVEQLKVENPDFTCT